MTFPKFPFYQKARDLFLTTQVHQVTKGLKKYSEPFTPQHWTPKELLNHALEETVDLVHYIAGLSELLEDQEREIKRLKAEVAILQEQIKPTAQTPEYDDIRIKEPNNGVPYVSKTWTPPTFFKKL